MAEVIGISKTDLYTQVQAGGETTMDVDGIGILLVQIASRSNTHHMVNIGANSVDIVSGFSILSNTNESGKMNISFSGSTITFTNNASSPLVIRAYYYRIS